MNFIKAVASHNVIDPEYDVKLFIYLKVNEMEWIWDKWQEKVLAHQGSITIRAGRQSGKSEVISQKARDFAFSHPGTVTLIIASTQRQSGLIFEKCRGRCDEMDFYAEKPTLTKIVLQNGSRIYCVPAGRTGHGIRGYTVDLLIADEAAFIPETVWMAVTPMLAVSSVERGFGWVITISTPYGKGGYFYDTFSDSDILPIHVSSEDCRRISKKFLQKEKRRMTKMEYRQEYQAEWTDEWNQFFSTSLLKSRMTFIEWSKAKDYRSDARYYLGVDIARYGGDENAFVICELWKKKLKIVKCFTTDRVSTVDTIGRIAAVDEEFGFKKIFIDDAGIGGGVTDVLIERFGRRVMGLNNASKRIQVQGEERKKGILKEDLYSNVLMLLETGRLTMIDDLSLLRSMKCITYEYGEIKTGSRNIKIFGDYSHLAEGLIRACWCIKERGLDLYVF